MILLITYVLIALIFSFLCSIAEAVLLSITPAHIKVLENEEESAGAILRDLKADINQPLAAILTLNTIAHTTGAVGAGAQASVVFGSAYIGISSAILTLLILIFSEIIPKTIGATYWRELAPATAFGVKFITWLLHPFVRLSEIITSGFVRENSLTGFSREEFSAMAELSADEGTIEVDESRVLRNLLLLKETCVESAMTPRTVVFSLSDKLLVEEFFHKYDQTAFSRILTYKDDVDNINGFIIRGDLLLAQARGSSKKRLGKYRRNIGALLNTVSVSHALNEMLQQRAQIMLVVDEYGTMKGIITLEDLIEALLGLEIMDEKDKTENMQRLAKKHWIKKAKKKGIGIEEKSEK
jgi:CBS domain containing-hemolysin-like protein